MYTQTVRRSKNVGKIDSRILSVEYIPPSLNQILWLRADSGLVLSSQNVTYWTDKSVSGYIFSSNISGHTAPTKENQNTDFNSKPTINFNRQSLQATTSFSLPSKLTICAVLQIIEAGDLYHSAMVEIGDATNQKGVGLWYMGPNSAPSRRPSMRIRLNGYAGNNIFTTPVIMTATFDSTASSNLYINNVLQKTQAIAFTAESLAFRLGKRGDNSNYQEAGIFKLAELLIYDKILTLEELTNLYNGLKAPYNIS